MSEIDQRLLISTPVLEDAEERDFFRARRNSLSEMIVKFQRLLHALPRTIDEDFHQDIKYLPFVLDAPGVCDTF